MKIRILIIEIGIKNIRNIKHNLDYNELEIIYASSFLDVIDVIFIKKIHIIVFSEFRGPLKTIGYIKMFKTTNPDFILLLLSNDKEVTNRQKSYYIQRGARSLISCYDVNKIVKRLNYYCGQLMQDRMIKDEWCNCTKKAIRYFKDNYHKNNNILKVASMDINYSVSSIIHSVKNDTGQNVSEWLQKLRVYGAIELLRATDFPIKSISNHVGYKSTQGLIKAFKKITGKTPTNFRNNI